MPVSNSNLYMLAAGLLLACVVLQSYRSLPPLSLPTSSTPTPLTVPWPVLLVGTTGVSWMHALMLRLAPPSLTLYWHAGSFAITGALRAAAKLRIADALESGGKSVLQLANATGCYAPHLQRLLVALETIHTFQQRSDGLWYNSPMSEYIRSSHPASMRHALLMLGEEQYVSFSRLDYALTTARPAFPFVYGHSLYRYLERHPASYETFARAQHSLSFLVDPLLASDYPFDEVSTLVDVAGGMGAMLRDVMGRWSHIDGVLVERGEVVDLCEDEWRHSRLANRTRLVRGDMFDATTLPGGADAYMLKQVLHQWDDEHAALILRQLVEAAGPSAHTARYLVVDRIMRPHASFIASHGAAFVDLVMMSVFEGGYERYEADWRRVFRSAGLQWRRTVETRSDFAVMECWYEGRSGAQLTEQQQADVRVIKEL